MRPGRRSRRQAALPPAPGCPQAAESRLHSVFGTHLCWILIYVLLATAFNYGIGFRAESTSAFTVPRGSDMELLKINQSHLTARGSALGCSAQGASRWPRILPARALILGKPGSKCTWVWGNDALCLSRAAVFSLSPVLCPSFRLCSVQALADSL